MNLWIYKYYYEFSPSLKLSAIKLCFHRQRCGGSRKRVSTSRRVGSKAYANQGVRIQNIVLGVTFCTVQSTIWIDALWVLVRSNISIRTLVMLYRWRLLSYQRHPVLELKASSSTFKKQFSDHKIGDKLHGLLLSTRTVAGYPEKMYELARYPSANPYRAIKSCRKFVRFPIMLCNHCDFCNNFKSLNVLTL